MISKYRKQINIGLDVISILSLIAINIIKYNKLNTFIMFGLLLIKAIINFQDIRKSILYYGIILIMLLLVSYTVIAEKNFQFNEYTTLTIIVTIGMCYIFLVIFRECSSAIVYITLITVISISLGYINTYSEGINIIKDRYGEDYTIKLLRNEEFDKYSFNRIYDIQEALIDDKDYRNNLYNIIKTIENDKEYIFDIGTKEGDKLDILESVGIEFLNKINKRENCTIDDLCNTEYVNESIVAYGGK